MPKLNTKNEKDVAWLRGMLSQPWKTYPERQLTDAQKETIEKSANGKEIRTIIQEALDASYRPVAGDVLERYQKFHQGL